LAEVVAALAAAGDDVAGDAHALRGWLEPWRGQNVVLGSGALCLGAASHYLGLLARAAGDTHDARRLLADAVAMNTAMDAAPLAERPRLEAARAGARPASRSLVSLGPLPSWVSGGVTC
ncbi:MAG: hypothetical protein QOE59_2643, partial [Actinomycetota bacterium]|nr:hypothetical protein [Actinomycetota bacterium]